ncbi:hypothetical protein M8037_31980 [Sinorhizobium meliloti]|uniref:hypothetical protein n=1 Tax=Rhizobium meliloti TaxID=382 RepID=UPI002073D10A|nr:hypothetical protein [Sinorhizobium meliloti]MCM5693281.1 hypothetical protein [Sinorhizobium meliloti]
MQPIDANATPFGDTSTPFMLSLDMIWSQATDDTVNIEWVRSLWTAKKRHSPGRSYLNFPGLGESENLVRDAVGAGASSGNMIPTNLFRLNQNIQS